MNKSKSRYNSFEKKIKLIFLVGILLMVFNLPVAAQYDHTYPRVGVFHFGTPAPADWYAKFDFVIVRSSSTSLATKIKSKNPATLVFSTLDWNAGAALNTSEHDEWIVRTSTGERVTIYSAPNVFTFPIIARNCPNIITKDIMNIYPSI